MYCYVLWMQAFSKLPDTLDEIDARLNEERARTECFSGLNENVSALVNRLMEFLFFKIHYLNICVIISQYLYRYIFEFNKVMMIIFQ